MFDRILESDRRVIATLWRMEEASRAEIADAVGLTKAAVTQIARGLEARGLIEEREPRRGQRGQPARPLVLAENGAFSAGVNFSHSYLEAGIVNLRGEPLGIRRLPLSGPTVDSIAEAALSAIHALVTELKLPRERLIGIGFSAPGDFLQGGRLAAHAYFPELQGVDLRAELAERIDLDLYVENDGKACAVGELILGAGREHRSFMVVHIGHGVGGGIIVEGRLHRGAHGNAGPLGAFFPVTQPRPSGQDLLETLREAGIACSDFDALESLCEHAAIKRWTQRAGAQLQTIVPSAASIVDPEVVVLGGRLPPALLEAIVAAVDMKTPFLAGDPLDRPILVPSRLGSQAGVIGSALLPIHARLFPRGEPGAMLTV